MKNILASFALSVGTILSASAQLQTPKASPFAKIEQRVGLTDIKIEYSRPSKNERVVFGDLVPMDSIWRTGANENTKITNDQGAFADYLYGDMPSCRNGDPFACVQDNLRYNLY